MKQLRNRIALLRIAIGGVLIAQSVAGLAQRGSQSYVFQVYRGQEALAAHKWSSAESHFRAALVWDSKGIAALNGLGAVYLKTGQLKRADEEFSTVLRLKPHSAEAERGLRQARQGGDEENALRSLAEQVQREPQNADAHTTYAEELFARGRLEDARKEAQAALKLDQKQGHAYRTLGTIATRENRDEEAQALLRKAVQLDRTDADALDSLGEIAMRRRDFKEAAACFRRLTRLVPGREDPHTKLVKALNAQGDARKAGNVTEGRR